MGIHLCGSRSVISFARCVGRRARTPFRYVYDIIIQSCSLDRLMIAAARFPLRSALRRASSWVSKLRAGSGSRTRCCQWIRPVIQVA